MTHQRSTYQIIIALLICFLQTAGIDAYGQNRPRAAAKRDNVLLKDSLTGIKPKALQIKADTIDSIAAENKRNIKELTTSITPEIEETPTESLQPAAYQNIWRPNPTKATWMALIIPGGGQIYNKKYWKLPIFYGGFAGCAYALTWNGKMYKDYSSAYKDAVNERWNSTTITDLLPPGYINRVSKSQLTELLRKRKDTYRRYRDLSIFAFIGVYLLSVVDAYIDAELSNFDITPDLSMKIEPASIENPGINSHRRNVGVQCSFSF